MRLDQSALASEQGLVDQDLFSCALRIGQGDGNGRGPGAGGAEAGEAHLHVPSTSFLQKQAGSFGRRAEIMLCNW